MGAAGEINHAIVRDAFEKAALAVWRAKIIALPKVFVVSAVRRVGARLSRAAATFIAYRPSRPPSRTQIRRRSSSPGSPCQVTIVLRSPFAPCTRLRLWRVALHHSAARDSPEPLQPSSHTGHRDLQAAHRFEADRLPRAVRAKTLLIFDPCSHFDIAATLESRAPVVALPAYPIPDPIKQTPPSSSWPAHPNRASVSS